jgi:hypothetical protein
MRASDADRESVARLLDEAYTDGRLTRAEHAERVGQALQAKTVLQLQELVADLAPSPTLLTPTTAPRPLLGASELLPTARDLRAVLGDIRREGPWLVPAQMRIGVLLGDATLDLRTARFEATQTFIDAWIWLGDLKLLVPDGVSVLDNTTHVLGNSTMKGMRAPKPGQYVITVQGVLLLGDVKVLGPDARLRGRDRRNAPPAP